MATHSKSSAKADGSTRFSPWTGALDEWHKTAFFCRFNSSSVRLSTGTGAVFVRGSSIFDSSSSAARMFWLKNRRTLVSSSLSSSDEAESHRLLVFVPNQCSFRSLAINGTGFGSVFAELDGGKSAAILGLARSVRIDGCLVWSWFDGGKLGGGGGWWRESRWVPISGGIERAGGEGGG